MARVAEDLRLSDGKRLVLIYCALQYVKSGELSFCVRQRTVADHLGMRRQTVGDALAEARTLGWLNTRERQRGRGYHQADYNVLTFPDEIGTHGGTYSSEDVRAEAEIGTRGGPEDVRAEAEIGTYCDNLTSGNADPYRGVIQGGTTGYISQGVARDGPAPFSAEFGHLFDHHQPVQPPLLAAVRELDTNVIDAEEVPDPDTPRCTVDGCDKTDGTTEFDGVCGHHAARQRRQA
jgi:hypothetical protein